MCCLLRLVRLPLLAAGITTAYCFYISVASTGYASMGDAVPGEVLDGFTGALAPASLPALLHHVAPWRMLAGHLQAALSLAAAARPSCPCPSTCCQGPRPACLPRRCAALGADRGQPGHLRPHALRLPSVCPAHLRFHREPNQGCDHQAPAARPRQARRPARSSRTARWRPGAGQPRSQLPAHPPPLSLQHHPGGQLR